MTRFSCLLAVLVAAGCASTNVSHREELVTGQIPRPNNILVYNFAASAADVPPHSALAGQYSPHPTPQSDDDIAVGRKLGAEIAQDLVAEIRSMGMPALLGTAATAPQINDLEIRGYLISVHQGSAAERMSIGMGAGASDLRTAVEGFQVTPQGLRKLGGGDVDSGGSKTPGAAVGVVGLLATANPAGLIVSTGMKAYGEESGSSKVEGRAKATAKEIAQVLQKRFQEQGWID